LTALIGPVERQIEFSETCCREFDGLPAVQERLDQLRAQKGEVDEVPDIATRDTIALGQFPKRPGASRGKLLEPSVPACCPSSEILGQRPTSLSTSGLQ
jgi:hypothetical protein